LANGDDLPGAVLFACGRNAVRSPMAAAILRHLAGKRLYVDSAGVRVGERDPFAIAAMDELGIDLSGHRPTALDDLHDMSFDVIIALSRDAHQKAVELAGPYAVDVEFWPTPDPTGTSGNREQILSAYRAVRDELFRRIKTRFLIPGAPTV
jgi:protein-tyrosine-phosphatase